MIHGDPNQMLIADLSVIEHVDIYSQFQSLDFLRQLRKALGDDDWALSEQVEKLESAEPRQQAGPLALGASSKDRRSWIDGLTPDHQLTLRTKYNRFRAFSQEHQQRLRQLHQQLVSAPDAIQLQGTISQYQQWLDGQPSSRRFELREMSENLRVQAIVRQVRENRSKTTLELTDEQIDKMIKKLQQRMPEIRDRTQAKMNPEYQQYMTSLEGRKRWWALLRWMTQHHSDAADELRAEILQILTETQREQFQQVSHQDQWRLFFGWLRASRFQNSSRSRRAEVGEQDMENFFAEGLNAAQKEELLALPRDVMRRQLERLYWGIEGRSGFEGLPGRRPGHPDRPPRDDRPGHPRPHLPRDGFRPHKRGPQDRGPRARGPRPDVRQRS
jgi:hypothetical protein